MTLIERCRLAAFLAAFSLVPSAAQADSVPELLHYRFDDSGTSVDNLASSPPVGTTTATLMGLLTQAGTDLNTGGGGFSLLGTGTSSASDYLNTGWATSLSGTSWTISFVTSNIPSTTSTYYIFGDVNAGGFRCFTGGVANPGNWILRGNGITDVYLNGGASAAPSRNTFVYDMAANEIRAYLNGVLVNTVAQAGPLTFVSAGPFKVGAYSNSANLPSSGLLDDFRLYNRALTAAEVLDIDVRPVVEVIGNAVSIDDGDETPDAADHSDFGDASINGGTVTRTFVLENRGNVDLNITGITFSGANPGDFSITAAPVSPVASAGGSTTFDVTFDPGAVGARTAVLNIASDDPRQNPYDFAIQGNGLAPDIAVSGNAIDIAAGDLTPDLLDHTDFGMVAVNAGTLARTFTISNAGDADLSLGAVVIGGPEAADFTVSVSPAATVTPGSSTTLEVTFDPAAIGLRSATVSIGSDDPDEAPFVFALQGNGMAPDIAVSGNAIDIAAGDLTPDLLDHTDFGVVPVSAGTLTRTFTIGNAGNADLSLVAVAIGGTEAADFTVSVLPAATVTSGSSTTLEVTFDPAAPGLRSATVSIDNSDDDENPFVFAVQGIGASPEIAVSYGGSDIPDGDTTPRPGDGTDFGTVALNGASLATTFSIENLGGDDLTLSQVVIGGPEAADFTVSVLPAATVAPGSNTTLEVTFDPSAAGLRSATVSIANDDSDENAFEFAIQGTGGTPEIAVSYGGFDIPDGDATPSLGDGTDFGTVALSAATAATTFTIENQGNADLLLTQVVIGGSESSDFTVSLAPATVGAGANTTLQVTFDPSAAGLRSATVSIDNDDGDENPFTFSVQGTGAAADVQVSKTNFEDGVYPGRDTIYTIQVLNAGPVAVSGVHVVDDVADAAFADVEWSCTSAPVGLCPNASGTSDIDETTGALPNGALLEYTLAVTPIATSGSVSNTAIATSLDGDDPTPANNTATDEDSVLPDTIFGDGFEDAGSSLLRAPIGR